jgi:4-carboxymuconolactone decarboxylase
MRFPPIHPSNFSTDQKELYDDMRAGIATGLNSFSTSLDDGSMIGPWNASLHHPAIGKAFWQLTKAISSFGTVPANVKEVAILVVGGFHKASYEIYAHVAVAEHMGMLPARISALLANVKPNDLTAEESTAFDLAFGLCRGGPLPEVTWRLAVQAFGEVGAAQLVYLVGLYAFVSTALNGFDVPLPDDASARTPPTPELERGLPPLPMTQL